MIKVKKTLAIGFSLIETFVVLLIVAVLVAMVVPSQGILLEQTTQQTQSLQLLRAINLTRSEAVLRGTPVTLCESDNMKTCGGHWQDGYIILANSKTLFAFRNQSRGILHWRAFPKNEQYLQFLPTGMPHAENGTFWFCGKNEKNPIWAIVLNQAGRTRLAHPDKNNEILDDKGDKLVC